MKMCLKLHEELKSIIVGINTKKRRKDQSGTRSPFPSRRRREYHKSM